MSNAGWPECDCPVRRGDLVAGNYRVDRILGAGGMGIVVAATQVALDRVVALKFLLPRVLERPDHVARFAREARAAAKLQSEHVTRVLEVGSLESGAAYIVMEYLEGEDLSRVLAARGPLPCTEAVGYVLEASEAIAEAHALGIVHRDLKPANLFLANRTHGRPIIKVLDFGLSKIAAGDEHVTSESAILGSPLYMSPEQMLSAHAADARSDIWSLGVVLYELLTARPAFPAGGMPELVASVLHGREPALESLRSDIPAGLRTLVHRCLEKDPSDRFADIAHFATALAPFGPPSSQASVDRISHLLGRAGKTTVPSPETPAGASPTETKPGIGSPVVARAAGEVPSGSSQALTLPSSSARVATAGAHRPPSARRVRTLAAIAVLAIAAVIGFVATPRPMGGSRDAPGATGVRSSRNTAGALVERDLSPSLTAEPTVLLPTAAPTPAPYPPLPASTSSTTGSAVQPKGTVAPRGTVGPTPPSAASPDAAAAPSTSVDPLARLKTL